METSWEICGEMENTRFLSFSDWVSRRPTSHLKMLSLLSLQEFVNLGLLTQGIRLLCGMTFLGKRYHKSPTEWLRSRERWWLVSLRNPFT